MVQTEGTVGCCLEIATWEEACFVTVVSFLVAQIIAAETQPSLTVVVAVRRQGLASAWPMGLRTVSETCFVVAAVVAAAVVVVEGLKKKTKGNNITQSKILLAKNLYRS